MATVLRIVGGVWVLLTLSTAWELIQRLLHRGPAISLGVTDVLNLLMLAGGIGLILLKEWGRWILLLGAIAFLLLLTLPALLQFKIGPVVIRHFVFYGIFIALLILPQAKSATR